MTVQYTCMKACWLLLLFTLQQNKATGLVKMDELTKLYKEYEEVVVEHRAMKERARLKAEQEERERKAATKVS